jgi:hypothetical protein
MSEPAICRRLQLSAAGLAIIGDLGSRSVRLSGASGSRSVIPGRKRRLMFGIVVKPFPITFANPLSDVERPSRINGAGETLRWRERDSNPWSHAATGLKRRSPARTCSSAIASTQKPPSSAANATHPNSLGDWLHGMASRTEEIAVTHRPFRRRYPTRGHRQHSSLPACGSAPGWVVGWDDNICSRPAMPAIGSPSGSSATPFGCTSGSRSGCGWWRSYWPPAASL